MKKIFIHQLLLLIITFSVLSKRTIKHRYLEDGAEDELVEPDGDIMEDAPEQENESEESDEEDEEEDDEDEQIVHRGIIFKDKVVLSINQ